MADIGTFRTTILLESAERRGETRPVDGALVDSGSEYTWVPTDGLEARSLEGMNLRVDALRKQLVPAGPVLAGAARRDGAAAA
jgi:hypothetical protein